MRIKKDYVILTFRTTTEAMAMENQAMELGIPGRLIPIPREITAGCGLAWRICQSDYLRDKDRIENMGLCFEDIVPMKI